MRNVKHSRYQHTPCTVIPMFWKAPIRTSGLAEEEILRLQGLDNDWPLPESCIVGGAVAMIGDDETEGRRRSEVEPKFAWQLWYCKGDRL
jgi:hypothetical protein